MKLFAYSNQLAENLCFEAPENVCEARIREHLEHLTGRAIACAVELVKRREGVTPTASDIADATRRYCACIVDDAQAEVADITPAAVELAF